MIVRLVVIIQFVLLATLTHSQKILIVSTNVDSLHNSANGTFLMEIAYPFKVFQQAGYDIDIVTPKGGRAAIYHNNVLNEELIEISNSKLFKEKTLVTLAPDQIKTNDYAGIYYPGGGGQFFDVVDNKGIARIAADIYERGGVLGAAGHGPASLINIQLSNSEFLVKGKKITCFPKAYSAKWLPFDWEVKLKERGAEVVIPVTDVEKDKGVELLDQANRIITGSFAENAQWVAHQMLKLIEKK